MTSRSLNTLHKHYPHPLEQWAVCDKGLSYSMILQRNPLLATLRESVLNEYVITV